MADNFDDVQNISECDSGRKTPSDAGGDSSRAGTSQQAKDKEKKLGHRRVGVGGETTYKKIESRHIMGSIQLGIQHAVGGLASKPERDLLMHDFMTVETINFPTDGSKHTPAHYFHEFKFKNYAPIAFRYFRDLFEVQPQDYLMSMCSKPLRELSNPGASGSIFYLTEDDEFIIKTVQHKEGEFLQKLLPGYYMNLNQNPRTLLPKFFGLYCYQCNSKNIRLVAMNNLLPSAVKLHEKYDLKGSTCKRKASKKEKAKKSPTYKDLDFMEMHPEGLFLEADTYIALNKTIQRDCLVLESFKIMDYSLLVGMHNLDLSAREKAEGEGDFESDDADGADEGSFSAAALGRSKSINRQRIVAHSTAMESIQAESEPIDQQDDIPAGGIPARNARGERLLLFIGIIDILQSYRLKKKLEHSIKALIHDGDTVSVHRPGFYAQRFQHFMANTVFKKIQSSLKNSPSKRKGLSKLSKSIDGENGDGSSQPGFAHSFSSITPSSTPPPAFEDAVKADTPQRQRNALHPRGLRDEIASSSDVRLEHKSSLSVESSSSSGAPRGMIWTPPASVEGSTPTWTEGTPSFTESSSSGDIGNLSGCQTTPQRGSHVRRDSSGPKSLTDDSDQSFEMWASSVVATNWHRKAVAERLTSLPAAASGETSVKGRQKEKETAVNQPGRNYAH